jgi:radical SAM protein with 4Fe4S-binding SPASM domain
MLESKPTSRVETTTEFRLRSKKNFPSLARLLTLEPPVAKARFALRMTVEHYKRFLPPNARRFLVDVPLLIIRQILEQHMTSLSIEVTNICSASCQFCGYRYQERPAEIMSNALFRHSVLQYVAAGGGRLELTPIVGDPLVDKDLVSKIRFARNLKEITYISLYTNLIGLDSFNPRHFLSSGIDEINISTCLGSREMYARIFGVDKYDSVLQNLDTLLRENRRLGSRVKVLIHLKADKPYSQTTSSVDYQRICRHYGRALCHFDDQYDNWTGLVETDDLPKHHSFRNVKNVSEVCSELYNGMIIFVNGDVGICWRRDLDAKLVIGNIHESSLEGIWRGERLHAIRRQWVNGNIPEICRRCYCHTPMSRLLVKESA